MFLTRLLILLPILQYSKGNNNSGGYTIPAGDIDLLYGRDPLNITCVIRNKTIQEWITRGLQDRKPSDFTFNIGKEFAPIDKVFDINSTAIQYYDKNPEKMAKIFACVYRNVDNKHTAIASNSVIVGTKPTDVTDFDCLGYNLEKIECTFTRDLTTMYAVNYTLSFYMSSITSKTECNLTAGEEPQNYNRLSCLLTTTSRPYYRPMHDFINFILVGTNLHGNHTQLIQLEHYKHVKTSAPSNFHVISNTTSSLALSWEIPESMVEASVHLRHRIMYTFVNSGFPDFKVADTIVTNCSKKQIYYNLTDLPYPYTLYDVRVSMRINIADADHMWSENATLTNYTDSTLPVAPERNLNCFYESSNGVVIYWKPVHKLNQNGPDFMYVVEDKTDSTNTITETKNAYLKLTNLNRNKKYTFDIRSKNTRGTSRDFARVVVPALEHKEMEMNLPVFKEYNNTFYQLSWGSPTKGEELLINYTVYWCESTKVSVEHLCSNINWVTLPKDVRSYNLSIKDDNNVEMAISANGIYGSMGMLWPECIVRHDAKPFEKIKITDVDVTPYDTSINLKWGVKCMDKTRSIQNYDIVYCAMTSTRDICNGDEKNKTVPSNGTYFQQAHLDNLEPYTTYRIQISMKDVEGSTFSTYDPIFKTTEEGTPGTPMDLNITEETSSSISFEWSMLPKGNNHVIRHFEIQYNNMTTYINRTSKTELSKYQNYTLTGLLSYQTYNVSVTACIQKCSARSKVVTGKTKIGYPSQIDKVYFNSLNNSVSWGRPTWPGGHLDYYEIEVTFGDNEEPTLHNLTSRTFTLDKCGENSPYSTVSYKVRAINIDEGQVFPGPWSMMDEQKCQKIKDYSSIIYIIVVILTLSVISVVFVLFGKRCYNYVKTMSDVQFQLPEGLKENDRFPRSTGLDYTKEPAGDDQFLLADKGVKRSGDSSGCSSGPDSAESDSSASLSSSADSGTEQPRSKDDDLVEAVALDDFNPSASDPAGGAYCQLGYQGPETREFGFSNGYVPNAAPVPSAAPAPAPAAPPPAQSSSPGYVPHPVKSDYVPHSSYVMAADKGYTGPAETKGYVQVAEAESPQPPPPASRSNGYVSCGDAKSLPASPEVKSGGSYVSHKQFDGVLKND